MGKLRFIGLIGVLLAIIVACQSQDDTPLPTIASLPTVTETDIPPPTETNTPTVTSTATDTPTPTATFTPSNTPTATNPPVSATPTLTLTPSQTFTPSITPTSTASITPLFTATPQDAVIRVFQSSRPQVEPGANTQLRWDTTGETARIERLGANGAVAETFDVEQVGSITVTTPNDGSRNVTYRLTVTNGSDVETRSVLVQLGATCDFDWFSDDIPDSAGCPLSTIGGGQLSYQTFVSGYMFRITGGGIDRICAMQFDRNLYSCYAPQNYTGTPPVTPPSGLLPPDARFANVFYTQLAIGGFWSDVIGFATTNVIATNALTQVGADDNRRYIQLPIGLYSFDANLTGQGVAIQQVN